MHRPAHRTLLLCAFSTAVLAAVVLPGQAGASSPSGPLLVLRTEHLGAAPGDLAVLLTTGGAAEAQLPVVEAYASSHGLTVSNLTSRSLVLSGPGPRLAGLFATTLTSTAAGLPYATTPPQVPLALAAAASSAVGLDARPVMTAKAVPGGYVGADLRSAYGVAAGGDGNGLTVGTLQYSGWAPGDLTAYALAAGLSLQPGQITEVAVAGASPHALDGTGGEAEVALDVQAVLATAPLAKQRIYFSPNTAVGSLTTINQMADDAAAGLLQVTSSSWGSCEAATSPEYQEAFGAGLNRLVAAGATFFVASGDAGSYGCSAAEAPDNQLSVDFPSSWPSAVSVGGTRLTRVAQGFTETAWGAVDQPPSPGVYAGAGSGGGSSLTQPQPAHQRGLLPGVTTRLVPDVSSVADPGTGFGAYVGSQGGWLRMGGTSLAAPTWAGFTAAALSRAGRTTGLGNILPTLYANPGAFNDVSAGSNGAYAAGVGFDLVTGLGSPNWALLSRALLSDGGVSIDNAVTQAPYGSTFTISGTAPRNSLVTLAFHRAGTAANDYSIVRSVPADGLGRWSRPIGSDTDYRYYARVGSAISRTVLFQPVPALSGPASRTVVKNSTYLLTGRSVPGSTVALHFHAPGTPANDYSIVRTVIADSAGNWTRRYSTTMDYRLFASRSINPGDVAASTFLIQAR